jgi:hypothetical protein
MADAAARAGRSKELGQLIEEVTRLRLPYAVPALYGRLRAS